MAELSFDLQSLIEFFSNYAYQPALVYSFIILFMTASSFGLPIPEELVLISCGLVAFMAGHPEKFPPPYPGAEPIHLFTLMTVCFFSVFFSDLIVFFIGRFFGDRLVTTNFYKKRARGKIITTVQSWFDRYGPWCAGIFRFTPALRFPGHLSCGIFKVPIWKFAAIDGIAALVSVPTQVWFVAKHGEEIFEAIQKFKLVLLASFVIFLIIYFGFLRKRKTSGQKVA